MTVGCAEEVRVSGSSGFSALEEANFLDINIQMVYWKIPIR